MMDAIIASVIITAIILAIAVSVGALLGTIKWDRDFVELLIGLFVSMSAILFVVTIDLSQLPDKPAAQEAKNHAE